MSVNAPIEVSAPPETRQRLIPRWPVVLGIIVVLVLSVAVIAGIVWLAPRYAPEIETIRDIVIIALAIESCLFGIVLILMLVMIVRLVNMVEFEIKPILHKTSETIGVVRGTSTFVSENVVKPTITATSTLAGVRRTLRILLGDPRKNLPD